MNSNDEPDSGEDRTAAGAAEDSPRFTLNRDAFMSKPAALRTVCSLLAAKLGTADYADIAGYDITRNLTLAQVKRLDWAMEQVRQRLVKMGGGGQDTPAAPAGG